MWVQCDTCDGRGDCLDGCCDCPDCGGIGGFTFPADDPDE